MRLIDADELKNQFSSEEPYGPEEIKGIIDNAPTVHDTINVYPSGEVIIQQTRPQGGWKTVEGIDGDDYYECSNCGEPWVLTAGTPKDNNMNFCPNCGADMRKGETNG